MSTSTFVHLMSVATQRYGNMPTGKGDDDGTIFSEFLRESRYPTEQKHVKWEQVRDILEKYKVSIPLLSFLSWVQSSFGDLVQVHPIL